MSRTYRRKNIKLTYYNFDSEEEFDVARHHYMAGAQKPTYNKPYPKLPLVREKAWWNPDRYHWVEPGYGHPVYKKWSQKTRAWWQEYYALDEYVNWKAADHYKRWGMGKLTFAAHREQQEARFHSDCGYPVHSHNTPRDFRNLFFHRPDRRKAKQLIRRGIELDNWDELNFPDKQAPAGWYYW